MQKIVIIALLFACTFAAQQHIAAITGTTAGYGVTMGVAHLCHPTCLTCKGPMATDCLSCNGNATVLLSAVGGGSCGCTATGTDRLTAASAALLCEDNTQASGAGTATQPLCTAVTSGYGAANIYWGTATTKQCEYCASKFKTCTGAAVGTACWATQAIASADCTYVAAKSYVSGDDTVYIQTSIPLSIINGYFYDSSNHEQKPCNAGCLTCAPTATPAVMCSTCAAGFAAVGTAGVACECAAGNFHTAATASAMDTCSPCQAGCLTCSSVTVCTVCDSSNQLGSTTDSSSTCETATSTTTAETVTTTGTSTAATSMDGESSNKTTDATTTNGVLITAATMLLAVILA